MRYTFKNICDKLTIVGDRMEKFIGKVIEVFIPEEKLDIMNSKNIGFKILINNEIIEVIQEQSINNSHIYKNDLVIITKQVISDKVFYDIEIYDGDDYE